MRSTLMMSAPRSARIMVAVGPATTVLKSSTRTPVSGGGKKLKIPRVTVAQVLRVPWYVGWPIVVVWTFGALYFFANRAIYYPSKYPEGFWDIQRAVGATDVWIDTRDGARPTEKGLYIDSVAAFTHLIRMGYRAESSSMVNPSERLWPSTWHGAD